jgi:LmbE family N-acetylglucosaminyl deacetylase
VSEPAALAEPKTGPVLAVFAHPDDAEISCGATLSKLAASGRETHLLLLTNGNKGSNDSSVDPADLARTRAAETKAAAAVLGLRDSRILPNEDGELENTPLVRSEVVRAIREIRPETVFTADPTAVFFENRYYNHADHRTAGWIALDAVFPGAGNPHFFPEQLAGGLEAWPVHDVRLAWSHEPTHREDISGPWLERKIAALSEHKSQVEGNMLGFFEEWLEKDAAEEGKKAGVPYAEAFRVLDLE